VAERQASAIPFRVRDGAVSFCVITTSSSGKWGFPKGIIEAGDSAPATALKEAREEAGLHGEIVGAPVGEFGIGAMKTSRPISEVMA